MSAPCCTIRLVISFPLLTSDQKQTACCLFLQQIYHLIKSDNVTNGDCSNHRTPHEGQDRLKLHYKLITCQQTHFQQLQSNTDFIWSRVCVPWWMRVQYSLSFSSVFGLHHLLSEISVFLAAKSSSMFTSCSLTESVCCLLLGAWMLGGICNLPPVLQLSPELLVQSTSPAKCEVDQMNSCRDNWRTDRNVFHPSS